MELKETNKKQWSYLRVLAIVVCITIPALVGAGICYNMKYPRDKRPEYLIRAKVFEKKYVPFSCTTLNTNPEKLLLVCNSREGETFVFNSKSLFGKVDQVDSIIIKTDRLDEFRTYLDIVRLKKGQL